MFKKLFHIFFGKRQPTNEVPPPGPAWLPLPDITNTGPTGLGVLAHQQGLVSNVAYTNYTWSETFSGIGSSVSDPAGVTYPNDLYYKAIIWDRMRPLVGEQLGGGPQFPMALNSAVADAMQEAADAAVAAFNKHFEPPKPAPIAVPYVYELPDYTGPRVE